MSNKYRFAEIKMQIKDLLEEAFELVPENARDRSASYWHEHNTHIKVKVNDRLIDLDLIKALVEMENK